MTCINQDMDTNGESSRILDDNKGKHAAMFLCWFLGTGSLLPWNSMLTIEDYYSKIFPNYHPTRMLTLVYSLCAFATIALLAHYEAKLNTRLRVMAGYSIYFVSSCAIFILDMASGGKGGIGPFIGLCMISAAFALADGHVQGGMIGDLSLMHPGLMQSYLAGIPASGTITSALRLFTKAIFKNSKDGIRKGAILFSVLSSLFEFICVLIYTFVFPKLPIVKYYRSKAAIVQDLNQEIEEDETQQASKHLDHSQLLLQNIDYAFGIFLVYALTLSIFPGFLSEDTQSHYLGSWYGLVLIALFNLTDFIGRYTPLIKQLEITSRKGLIVVIVSRFLFIPAFFFATNYGGGANLIFLLTSLLGLTNGHLTVLVLTNAPMGYEAPEQNALGNLLSVCLSAGLFAGVMLDWLWLIGKGW